LHFATHGLLAGEVAQLGQARAEPALVLSPPDQPTEEDDGLLTASEVAGLKLDADWVVFGLQHCRRRGGRCGGPLGSRTRVLLRRRPRPSRLSLARGLLCGDDADEPDLR